VAVVVGVATESLAEILCMAVEAEPAGPKPLAQLEVSVAGHLRAAELAEGAARLTRAVPRMLPAPVDRAALTRASWEALEVRAAAPEPAAPAATPETSYSAAPEAEAEAVNPPAGLAQPQAEAATAGLVAEVAEVEVRPPATRARLRAVVAATAEPAATPSSAYRVARRQGTRNPWKRAAGASGRVGRAAGGDWSQDAKATC